VQKAVEERAAEEVVSKAAAVEVVAAGVKRVATPSGSTPPAKCPYRGVWKPLFVQLSLPLFLPFLWLHSLTTVFA
jgi:hypothetical protein